MTRRHPTGSPTAEFQALCDLLSRRLGGMEDMEDCRRSVEHIADWQSFVAGAKRHRVTTLIQPILDTLPEETLPATPRERMRRIARANALQALRQIGELNRLLRLFQSAGIACLALKGIVLSQILYETPTQRGIGDIDLLIPPTACDRAHVLMTQAGYASHDTTVNAPLSPTLRSHIKEIAYTHPDGHLVEVHLRLWEYDEPPEGDFSTLWRRRRTVAIQHIDVPTLPTEALPLYLLEHGSWHCWDRLCWLADLAILLQDAPTLESLLEQARRQGLERAAHQALWLMNAWLGTAFPVDGTLATDADMAWFVRAFFSGRRWLDRPRPGSWPWFMREIRRRYWRAVRAGSWRHMGTIAARTLFNPVDAAFFPLPWRLIWLYPFLRPFGWIMRNFVRPPHSRK